MGLAVGDLNEDGRPDLVTVTEPLYRPNNPGTVWVYVNLGGHDPPAGVDPTASEFPRVFQLTAPRPNPLRGTSDIRFFLPSACTVDVSVYDLAGRGVRSLVVGEHLMPGYHSISWDARDASGARVRDGLYLVHVRAGRDVGASKLVVLR